MSIGIQHLFLANLATASGAQLDYLLTVAQFPPKNGRYHGEADDDFRVRIRDLYNQNVLATLKAFAQPAHEYLRVALNDDREGKYEHFASRFNVVV